MNLADLHNKTIFDFTNDADLTRAIIVVDKKTYFKEIERNPVINAFHLLELAERTEDDRLKAAVNTQFREELAAAHNER